ncbi:type VI secretion system accessory protein TagJ [Rhodopila globiformis]|uniref:SciE type virulence protein n=1 Tax=Rhodopila globiformis TaxID=1071 RepID=A0A2S6NFH5_RHOGL|nr:type VI secretion system accessory protein TagJ [Rhodopila globiformis]PPQ33366.1 SciE type virulence protein [Rhodopila globiformis]
MSDETVASLLRQGRLADAIGAAQATVRKAPTNLDARVLLAELLLAAGNLERADVLMDAAAAVDATASLVAAEFRQLIRAETARRQLFQDGRLPEFLSGPTPAQRLQLAAIVAMQAGDGTEAARQSDLAEATRPRVPGYAGDATFDDFRDADDLLAGSLEVLTTTGKYFWIPTERVTSAVFHPPARLRDLIWRRVSMAVAEGPEGDVYMPVIYPVADAVSDLQRLGRETDWREMPGGLVRGVGQKLFLAGEDGIDAMALTALRFGA